jgi:hypothetical protein
LATRDRLLSACFRKHEAERHKPKHKGTQRKRSKWRADIRESAMEFIRDCHCAISHSWVVFDNAADGAVVAFPPSNSKFDPAWQESDVIS